MRVKNRQPQDQDKEDARQPGGGGGENGRGLRAEDILGDPAPEGRPESFAFRTLHQDDEHHENGDNRLDHEQDVNQNGHRDGQYGQSG